MLLRYSPVQSTTIPLVLDFTGLLDFTAPDFTGVPVYRKYRFQFIGNSSFPFLTANIQFGYYYLIRSHQFSQKFLFAFPVYPICPVFPARPVSRLETDSEPIGNHFGQVTNIIFNHIILQLDIYVCCDPYPHIGFIGFSGPSCFSGRYRFYAAPRKHVADRLGEQSR